MTGHKKITTLPPQAITAILEILNNGNDVKITIGKSGMSVHEISTKRKYSENVVASGQR